MILKIGKFFWLIKKILSSFKNSTNYFATKYQSIKKTPSVELGAKIKHFLHHSKGKREVFRGISLLWRKKSLSHG